MKMLTRVPMIAGLGMLAAAGAAQVTEAELPEGPGKTQVVEACSVCHPVTQVTAQVRTQAEWADVVEQMIARGAQVSEDDYPTIVAYLGKNFGPATRSVPGNKAAQTPGISGAAVQPSAR